MAPLNRADRPPTIMRWLASTPRRTFVLYPALVATFEFIVGRGSLNFNPEGLVLLAWGYGQYRLSGRYRTMHGGGGPGLDIPPQRVVNTGIYAYLRNPMYLGHLIFMLGLVVTFSSWAALALLVFHVWWFNRRIASDEAHMRQLFGPQYDDYAKKVRRWGLV
ncbi:MAG: isoprenylcysteine carboxylmethyltransferase family protein [Beijerinckiaceae bacterium]|nr:isoprenylcysteine carboxylmethyltransferase family protein [Beijerinckiaceae bacterium]